ncbi:MAG: type III pantothenate kinase [Flavobacteriaceae bacterium]
MNLIIDIGNTRTKLAVFKADSIVTQTTSVKQNLITAVKKIIDNYPKISNTIVSSVDSFTENDEFELRQITQLTVLSHHLHLPFTNNYATPETLGVDRIALIAAAVKQYPNTNTLIIDAGTCVTYDFKTSNNVYLGGGISPGLTIRYNALHNLTAKLPQLQLSNTVHLIGNSTESSIHSGVINGLVNEIDGIISQYQKQYPNLTVILTGGDANFLAKRLKSSIFANSNFLLEGLNHLLKINID